MSRKAVFARRRRLERLVAGHDVKAVTPLLEDLGDVVENSGMAAEVARHRHARTRQRTARDAPLLIKEHRDVGAAEAIDGLLGIAHGAQLARV